MMRNILSSRNSLLCSRSLAISSSNRYSQWKPAPVFSSPAPAYLSTHKFMQHQKVAIYRNAQRYSSSSNSTDKESGKSATPPAYIDPDGESIYSGKFTSRIIRVKFFSLSTSIMGIFAQPVLWTKGQELGGTSFSVLMCVGVGFFTFVTPLLLHFVTKKYVIDVRYDKEKDEYTLITISLFLLKNKVKFKAEDVHVPDIETMFTSMRIGPKKIPVFMDAASFTDTSHYIRFMGYDKPIDIRLDSEKGAESPTKSNIWTKPPKPK